MGLADKMFQIICNSKCTLLSATIDLDKHFRKYKIVVNPKAHAMLIMLERFQDFLEFKDSQGTVIYEWFSRVERRGKKNHGETAKTVKVTALRRANQHYGQRAPLRL